MINPPEKAYIKQAFWSRLVTLGLLSLFLYQSQLLVMAAYAPLAIAFLLFGTGWGALLSASCAAIVFSIAAYSGGILFGVTLIPVLALGVLVSFMIRRGIAPQRIVVYLVASILLLIVIISSLGIIVNDNTFYSFCDNTVQSFLSMMDLDSLPEANEFKIMLTEGSSFGVRIKYLLPSAFAIAISFQVWLGMFFVMLYSAGWKKAVRYQYSLKSFLDYKNTEYIIIPFILLLGSYLYGYYFKVEGLTIFAANALIIMGAFFFFHGFGVYMAFLSFIKVKGFLKTVFSVIGIFFMYQLLAVIGVFDLWFDFRKFLQKKIES